ncbi:MAG: hypothetical protein R3D63_11765 [Paracoccaceae bacterium]
MRAIRSFLALVTLAVLSACGADHTYAPQAEVEAARYVAGPPTYITLLTTVNDRNGSGAHAALLVNASQRVLFDPAGTFYHPRVPIQNDVHYGMTDAMVSFYLDYHARDSATEKFHVIERKLLVSPQVAELVLQRVRNYGAVPKAMCSNAISDVLRGVPGMESLPRTWFPIKLGEAFGQLPGVTTRIVTEENDSMGEHNVTMVDKNGNPIN